jgi:hypothetical protein
MRRSNGIAAATVYAPLQRDGCFPDEPHTGGAVSVSAACEALTPPMLGALDALEASLPRRALEPATRLHFQSTRHGQYQERQVRAG